MGPGPGLRGGCGDAGKVGTQGKTKQSQRLGRKPNARESIKTNHAYSLLFSIFSWLDYCVRQVMNA
jgi:hypothetical protein